MESVNDVASGVAGDKFEDAMDEYADLDYELDARFLIRPASVCVLLYSGPLSDSGKARLKAMAETTDGFEIARRDLDIRGPGEFLGVDRVIERINQIGHRRHELHEEKDVGDVQLPHPVIDAHTDPQQTLSLDHAPIHHPGSVARDKDEHLGRVGESHRLEGEPRQEAAPVDMVYKDAKEGNAAKEIKPKVAF